MGTLKTAQIAQIRTLTAKESGGEFVVIVLTDGTEILRSVKAFAQDLKSSGHLVGVQSTDEIKSCTHPAIQRAQRIFPLGYLIGSWEFYKAGTEYEITENHPALTDKNHPLYGSVKLGSKMKRKSDVTMPEMGSSLTLKAETASYESETSHDIALAKSVFGSILLDNRKQVATATENSEETTKAKEKALADL